MSAAAPPAALPTAQARERAPGCLAPGALVLRLMLVAALAVALSGALAAWLVTRALAQEAVRRVVSQQTDEVEVVARLLASKIEQSQKLLRALAAGITPAMLDSPAALEQLLAQSLPALQFFDSIALARSNGQVRLNLRAGRVEKPADLDSAEREALRRTLAGGKPLVSELIAGHGSQARVLFSLPLHRADGSVLGVLGAGLRLRSQSLLPPAMTLPARADSRLLVFARDGTILAHPDPARLLGHVRDEAGLASVYARWQRQAQPVGSGGVTEVQPGHIVSLAGMPLPQWFVARVSASQALLAPLQGAQHDAWLLAVGAIALCLLLALGAMAWLARPLAQLRHSAGQLLRASGQAARAGRFADPAQASAGAGTAPADPVWPRAAGEVDALVRAFQGLARQGALQQTRMGTLEGQLRAVLESAPAGIAITRHGVLDVVGRQTCTLLGYSADELQGRAVRSLYANDADYLHMGERVRIQVAAHGAFDGEICFLRKDGGPVWTHAQGRAVRPGQVDAGMVWVLEDISAAREARAQQCWERTHDALTQLYNRAAFDERLTLLLAERGAREGAAPAGPQAGAHRGDGVVLFLDLDHFTVVNDIAGHDAGDDVLRHVARLLATQLRQIGWAARLGGDEFAVVLPGCALARGQAVAEQLRALVHAWEPAYQGRSFTLGISIGLVELDASLQDLPSVLYAADMACYEAKRTGRNRVVTRHAHQATPAAAVGRMGVGEV